MENGALTVAELEIAIPGRLTPVVLLWRNANFNFNFNFNLRFEI